MAIKRLYDTLIGATVGANQLVNIPDGTRTISGITTVRSDGVKISYSGTSTATGAYIDAYAYTDTDSFLAQFIAGHRYLIRAISSDNKLYIVVNKPYTDMYGINRREVIYTPSETPSYFYIRVLANNGEAVNGNGYLQVTDLTDYFSSASIADYLYNLETATAGAGIAKLHEWGFFTGEYIPYNAGSLESVEATAHKMVGFNQWDEEWELGGINSNTGMPATASDRIRSKNFCPIVPNTVYYGYFGSYASGGSALYIWFYDADQNFISGTGLNNRTTTAPANAYFFKLSTYGGGYTFYKNDICINLSSDRNGEYEPYTEQTYDYGTDILNGIFKLDANNNLYADGDRKTSDGTVTRKYGVVDLGTLNWEYDGDAIFRNSIYKAKFKGLGICSKYQVVQVASWSQVGDKQMSFTNSQNNPILRIHDSSMGTDVAAFKEAMSGVYLVYELATPTTEQSTPFTSPQICDPDGTEEYVTNNGVPAGHETRYQL